MKITHEDGTFLEARSDRWSSAIIGSLAALGGLAIIAVNLTSQPGQNLWVLGTLLFGFGALMLAFTPWVTIHVDKDSRNVTVERRRLALGASGNTFPISNVREVVVDEQIQHRTEPDGKDRVIHHLIFQMEDGTQEAIDITPSFQWGAGDLTSNRFIKNNRSMAFGNHIAQFMGVPCRDSRQATLGETVDAIGQILDAARRNIDPPPGS